MDRMLSPDRLTLCLCAALLACNGGSSGTTTTDDGTGSSSSGGGPTTDQPTLTTPTTGEDPTGTEPNTTAETTGTTEPPDTSTGAPAAPCIDYTNQNDCVFDSNCEWRGFVQYSYGLKGCTGTLTNYCIEKGGGGALSSWYREGDAGAVQFDHSPENLGPEWKTCDCDGPLACLCTFDAPDCPERLPEFCGGVMDETGCKMVTTNMKLVCEWFKISPEGAVDDACTTNKFYDACLPAEGAGTKDCEQIALDYLDPYGVCDPMAPPADPVYWRDNAGTLELTQVCGPKPVGWTLCEAPDTPEQPDECRCLCQ